MTPLRGKIIRRGKKDDDAPGQSGAGKSSVSKQAGVPPYQEEFGESVTVQELLQELNIYDHYADLKVQQWQAALKPGDFYVFIDDNSDLIFYGQILPLLHKIDLPNPNNFRRAKIHHVHKPEGVVGIFHVAWASGILSQEQFEKARDMHWPSSFPVFAQIVAGDPMWDLLPG